MNVDEATQAAKEYNENFVRQHFPLPSVTYSQRVAITLLAEVERLRYEVEFLKESRDAFMLLAGRMISDDSKLGGSND